MKKTILIGLLVLIPYGVQAAEPDWRLYDQFLQRYISVKTEDGITLHWLNYTMLKKDQDFTRLVQMLEQFPVIQLANRQEKLAFYINAYNILAINTVIAHWPVSSIKEVGPWYKPVWDMPAGRIGGKPVSLGEIEHDILRPMGEPRIHFAIVCASLSCPDLRTEAYRAEDLSAQLDDQVSKFVNNPGKGVKKLGNTLKVSKIFSWFEEDFKQAGGIVSFITTYMPIDQSSKIRPDIPYNWALNGD